jgi:nucleotide-binding universal stress UspA family protein
LSLHIGINPAPPQLFPKNNQSMTIEIIKKLTNRQLDIIYMSTKIKKGVFSKILVPVDGSESSLNATDYAMEMAKKDGAQVIALTVNRIPLSSYGLTTPQGELNQPKEREEMFESKQWFDKLKQNANQNNIQLKTEIISSQMSVEGTIVEYAESEGIDLIILGTKGSSGLKKMLLGSVASGVVSYATCPVMVVR